MLFRSRLLQTEPATSDEVRSGRGDLGVGDHPAGCSNDAGCHRGLRRRDPASADPLRGTRPQDGRLVRSCRPPCGHREPCSPSPTTAVLRSADGETRWPGSWPCFHPTETPPALQDCCLWRGGPRPGRKRVHFPGRVRRSGTSDRAFIMTGHVPQLTSRDF